MFGTTDLFIFYSYGLPLFVINLRTIYVLFRNRNGQFSSSYYRIFMLCGMNECLLYVLNNYCLRLPSIPFLYNIYYSHFDTFTYSQSFIYFLRRYCSYFIQFINPFLALNRLTAFWKYANHERIWEEYKIYWMFFVFSGSFLMSFQELFNATRFASSTVGNITVVQMVSDNYLNLIDTAKASAPTVATSTTIGILFSITTLLFWKKQKGQIPSKYRNFEFKLIWLTLVFYTTCIISITFHIVRYIIFNPVQQNFFYLIVSDISTLIPTFAFIVASSALRAAVFPFNVNKVLKLDTSRSTRVFHTLKFYLNDS